MLFKTMFLDVRSGDLMNRDITARMWSEDPRMIDGEAIERQWAEWSEDPRRRNGEAIERQWAECNRAINNT